jgi:Carboxypeptidase regulatory-like domain
MAVLRNAGILILTAVLVAAPDIAARAQTLAIAFAERDYGDQPDYVDPTAKESLPDAPGEQASELQPRGSIGGTVLDAGGAMVAGASVMLQSESGAQRSTTADGAGCFRFDALTPGTYKLTITSAGFAAWVGTDLVLQAGQHYEAPPILLQVEMAKTTVEVDFTRHDLAEDQMKAQEKQRVFGVIPNFNVSYVWNAEPLTAGQKFRLAWRSEIDPVSFAGAGFGAGLEQWRNDFRGYGQGAQGYFKRFGASYVDGFDSAMISGVILPSVLHQDPRYFYKGTGSVRSRAVYALSTAIICRGDNGRREPNYSNVLGNLASGAISNLYHPPSSRGVRLTFDTALLATAANAMGSLIQEFLLKKVSKGVQP